MEKKLWSTPEVVELGVQNTEASDNGEKNGGGKASDNGDDHASDRGNQNGIGHHHHHS